MQQLRHSIGGVGVQQQQQQQQTSTGENAALADLPSLEDTFPSVAPLCTVILIGLYSEQPVVSTLATNLVMELAPHSRHCITSLYRAHFAIKHHDSKSITVQIFVQFTISHAKVRRPVGCAPWCSFPLVVCGCVFVCRCVDVCVWACV
jgi:hypothetical protein